MQAEGRLLEGTSIAGFRIPMLQAAPQQPLTKRGKSKPADYRVGSSSGELQMGTIQANELLIRDSFQVQLIVPPYQRDYSWTPAKGIRDLWEDLTSHIEKTPEDEYLLGPIVTTSGQELHVIDGQQRLMSVFVMQAAFRERLIKLGGKQRHIQALENSLVRFDEESETQVSTIQHHDPAANDLLVRLALRRPEDPEVKGTASSISSMRLASAYRWFASHIGGIGDDPENVWESIKSIRSQVKFIRIEASDVSQALLVFERANHRGKLLDPSDLLKNLIFQHVPPQKFDDVAEVWRNLQTEIEYIQNVQIMDFLRWHHLSMPNGFYTTRQTFINRTQDFVREQDSSEYLTQLSGNARVLRAFAEDASMTRNGPIVPALSSIRRLGARQKQHYPLLLALASWAEGWFPDLARGVERILYVSAVTEYRSQDLERDIRSLTELARGLKSSEQNFVRVAEEIDAVCHRIEKTHLYSDKFAAISYEDNQGLARYVLSKIHSAIYCVWDNGSAHDSDAGSPMYAKSQIEHIWPKSDAAGLSEDLEDVHRIGNLTLLSAAINASGGSEAAQNKIVGTYGDEEDKYFVAKNLHKRTIGTSAKHAHRRAIDMVPTGFSDWGLDQVKGLANHYRNLMDDALPPVLSRA